VEALVPLLAIFCIFIGFPWLILHYRWKHRAERAAAEEALPVDNARLIALAEKLEHRVQALETILDAEVPDWRKQHRE
jgi:phage shock protein B